MRPHGSAPPTRSRNSESDIAGASLLGIRERACSSAPGGGGLAPSTDTTASPSPSQTIAPIASGSSAKSDRTISSRSKLCLPARAPRAFEQAAFIEAARIEDHQPRERARCSDPRVEQLGWGALGWSDRDLGGARLDQLLHEESDVSGALLRAVGHERAEAGEEDPLRPDLSEAARQHDLTGLAFERAALDPARDPAAEAPVDVARDALGLRLHR